MRPSLSFYAGLMIFVGALVWSAPLWLLWLAHQQFTLEQTGHAMIALAGLVVGGTLSLTEYAVYVKRRRWFERHSKEEALKAMPWEEFEVLVGATFKQWGFRVQNQGGARADGGIDLIVHKKGKRYLVQCKRYKGSVGVPIIREIFGVMISEGFDGAYIMTSGKFTKESWAFAKGKPMKLISGEALAKILKEVSLKK